MYILMEHIWIDLEFVFAMLNFKTATIYMKNAMNKKKYAQIYKNVTP